MYHVNLENKKKCPNRPKGSFGLLVLKITGMVMVLIFTSKHFVRAQVPDASYFQTIKTDIPFPPEAGKNVLRLFQNDGVITIVTDSGIFRYAKDLWERLSSVADSGSRWVAARNSVGHKKGGRRANYYIAGSCWYRYHSLSVLGRRKNTACGNE